ncbi:unnamed protein product [Adineta ricciae]|uniref:Uncharacterized protein n=1 Tax=Adineta ricciae TaxID=249248 RepID=A0A815F3J9_ADIRI|nr:unnamed protein product [Adineta ricciae]
MNLKVLLRWLYNSLYNYNLFIPDNDEYTDEESNNQTITLRQQKYTTWLYVLLLTISIYVLFYITLIKQQSKTIIISDITRPGILDELYLEHHQKLTCPCSTVAIPYYTFVNSTNQLYPICSSVFVTERWIHSLYFSNASALGTADFRTIANSQFQLLSSLCSSIQNAISQNEIDLSNTEFLSINLLSDREVQSQVNTTIELFINSISIRIISILNYLKIITQANFFVSALNTNSIISVYNSGSGYSIYLIPTVFSDNYNDYYGIDYHSVLCVNGNPLSQTGFFSHKGPGTLYRLIWTPPESNSTLANGFFAGCTPLAGILHSTLDCLYDIECIELWSKYFPDLNQIDVNWTNSILKENENMSVSDYLSSVFIEKQIISVNYSKYFHACSPQFCTYTMTNQFDFSYAITIFIGLYGGLIIILRLISPFLILFFTRFHSVQLRNFSTHLRVTVKPIKRLNLFKNINDRTENSIKQQTIVTRVYLTLLIGSILILVLFNSLSTQIITLTKQNPSLNDYNHLKKFYSDTLECPCSIMTISYQKLISFSPVLHQICTSDFLTYRWMSILNQSSLNEVSIDWRSEAFSQAQLLSNLCQLANETIQDAIHRFLLQYFVTLNVLSENDFTLQMNSTVNELLQSTIRYFNLLVETVRLLMQVDQPLMGIHQQDSKDNLNSISDIVTVLTDDEQFLQLIIGLSRTVNTNYTSINCICATNSNCKSPVAIYTVNSNSHGDFDYNVVYIVPGAYTGCSATESLLLSTFECFYADSGCFPILTTYIKEMYVYNVENPSWFDVHPLVYDPMSSNYPPNTTISTVVENMMIEQWNSGSSYESFYKLCAPKYCTYSENLRKNTSIDVIVALISMIGGLSVSLRLIIPRLVKFITKLWKIITNRRQEQQTVQMNESVGMKIFIWNGIMLLYSTIINLNMFSSRNFGHDVDSVTVKRLGQWATRLYMVLFTIGIIIFTSYTTIEPYVGRKTFDKPSFDIYNELYEKYNERLKCSCSLISFTYDRFVNVNLTFHQICSSTFTSDEWRRNLLDYSQIDYRRFLSSHLQYLQGLCELSRQSVNTTVQQFLFSLFIGDQLFSEQHFNDRLQLRIQTVISSAPTIFLTLLSFIQNINQGNAIVSTYGTNFRYLYPLNNPSSTYAITQPIIYDNNCSCAFYPNCTTQAYIFQGNSSEMVPIKGLKIGCIPSESFRLSTLECFYDRACLDLLQQSTNHSDPLPLNQSRFVINTTVDELISNLFIEQWSITPNYSLYFQQCSPSSCSYTFVQKINFLYTITLILGFQGGLNIVLKWICPQIIQILQLRKKRKILAQVTLVLPTIELHQTVANASVRYSFKLCLALLSILFLITILIIFSIFGIRKNDNPVQSTVPTMVEATSSITNSTTSMEMLSTSTNASVSTCPAAFQVKRTNLPGYLNLKLSAMGDVNNDNQLDLIFFSSTTYAINTQLGNGNGTFRASIMSVIGYTMLLNKLILSDFNQDKQLDIAFIETNVQQMGIMIGFGNGSFAISDLISTGNNSYPFDLIATDFNNDSYSDVAIVNYCEHYIAIFLGYGNGSFLPQTNLYTGRNSCPTSIAIVDFNRDDHVDILVVNHMSKTIALFLGYGNGNFQVPITSFAGGGNSIYPYYVVIADFNSDSVFDVALSYTTMYSIGIMFGYVNGSFSNKVKITLESYVDSSPLIANDFNCDGYLDIIIGQIAPSGLIILIGNGNGEFRLQTILSTQDDIYSIPSFIAGDLNNDGFQDLAVGNLQSFVQYTLSNICQCCVA